MSLPSRERGLKFQRVDDGEAESKSLPSRERGLKSALSAVYRGYLQVAPLAGARIEICYE